VVRPDGGARCQALTLYWARQDLAGRKSEPLAEGWGRCLIQCRTGRNRKESGHPLREEVPYPACAHLTVGLAGVGSVPTVATLWQKRGSSRRTAAPATVASRRHSRSVLEARGVNGVRGWTSHQQSWNRWTLPISGRSPGEGPRRDEAVTERWFAAVEEAGVRYWRRRPRRRRKWREPTTMRRICLTGARSPLGT
jgi:hypothetical protein